MTLESIESPRAYTVPFGHASLSFSLPPEINVYLAQMDSPSPLPNLRAAIDTALAKPMGTPSLEEWAASLQPKQIYIAFTDATRSCPDHLLVEAILDRLHAAQIPDEAITLICAVGLHRASTEKEKRAKLGDKIVNRYRVIDHKAGDPNNLIHLGHTDEGIPLVLNKPLSEADMIIATGIVEPHQYAGYSGGAKTVTIGCGGEETIAFTHSPAMLDHPGVRLGRIEENPFQAAVRQVAQETGLKFILNLVQDENHQPLKVLAGMPTAVHDRLVAFARQHFEQKMPHQFDVAIAGVAPPKEINLYQASRALTYLQLTAKPAVKPGGFLILPAPCVEGAGEGVGEQRFWTALREAPNVTAMLNGMRKNGYPPGAQRAFVVGQVLEQVDVIVVGAKDPAIVQDCKMIPVATMPEALALVTERLGKSLDMLIVPHALQTLIRVE